WEHAGAFGGEFDFDRFTAEANWYTTIYEDLLDRRTILALRGDAAYITGDAPFFERLYAGGIGSVPGFRYLGTAPRPRAGIADEPIGGNFSLTGPAELSFPIASELLRGVVFADAGTVSNDIGEF